MQQGWGIKKLGEVAHISPSKSEVKTFALNPMDMVSFLPMEDLTIGRTFVHPNKQKTLSEVEGSYTYFKEGDVLLAKVTPCFENGKLAIAKGLCNNIGFGSSEYIVIRPMQHIVNSQYLIYLLQTNAFRNGGRTLMIGACGLKRLPKPYVANYELPVPSLAEQERIVEILDREFERIDALKANAEKSLQHAKDLFQSALKQELQPKEGWVTASLNDLYDVRDGTHDSPKYTQQGYPFVTSKNLKDGKIDMSDVKYISKEDYDKINERSKVDVGDILFAMIGSNLGHPALVVDEPNYAIKNVALFKVPSSQSSRLLLYLLSSDLIMDKINKEKSGSSQPFVSLKYLRTFKVSIPMEYEQQEELALRIERLDRISKRLQSKYINIIALCDNMKQALLRKAFNGEL